ncbi:MAG: hypothetical protein IPM94_10570 [bacterium]|nr:hypothetical protein [bacterium]
MRIVLFGLSLLAALIVLDVYLQASGIQTPMETRIDPHLGPTYIPKMPLTRFNEGFYVGSTNRYGYMGPAIPPRSTQGEHRVLLLGDSYVLGHTVLPRHHFARRLESRLEETLGGEFHALNFGKADFNLWNMYQYHHDFAAAFDHDVTLFLVDENDLAPSQQIATDLYPTVKIAGDSLMIDRSFSKSGTYRFYKRVDPLLSHSAILRLAFNSYKMVKRGELAEVLLDKLAPERSLAAVTPEPARELPELSRVILRRLADDQRNILVIHKKLTPELLEEIAATGVPVIDLAACLDSLLAAGHDPYLWPVTGLRGHWNHATHEIIGCFLADELNSQPQLQRLVSQDSSTAN